VSTVVLDLDGAFVATCGACPYTEECPTEAVAERRAAAHERVHARRAGTMALLRRIGESPAFERIGSTGRDGGPIYRRRSDVPK